MTIPDEDTRLIRYALRMAAANVDEFTEEDLGMPADELEEKFLELSERNFS